MLGHLWNFKVNFPHINFKEEMIMVNDKKLIKAYQQVITSLKKFSNENNKSQDTNSTENPYHRSAYVVKDSTQPLATDSATEANLNALNTYLDDLEAFRQKLFLRVSRELSNQVMLTSEDLNTNLLKFLNNMHQHARDQFELSEADYEMYANIDLHFNPLIEEASNKLIHIISKPRKIIETTQYQGIIMSQVKTAHNTLAKQHEIDFIIKSRFIKFVSLNLFPERKNISQRMVTKQQIQCMHNFINNRVCIQSHDTTSQFLRQQIIDMINKLIVNNQQKQNASFFSSTRLNYANRIEAMRVLVDHLYGPSLIINQELLKKTNQLKQKCNTHTSWLCGIFSTRSTKTAVAVDKISLEIHRRALSTRFREETEVHLRKSLIA
jgi:hypothetical protein